MRLKVIPIDTVKQYWRGAARAELERRGAARAELERRGTVRAELERHDQKHDRVEWKVCGVMDRRLASISLRSDIVALVCGGDGCCVSVWDLTWWFWQ